MFHPGAAGPKATSPTRNAGKLGNRALARLGAWSAQRNHHFQRKGMTMNIIGWLNSWLGKRTNRKPRRRSKLQLVLEHLEDRVQPAVTGFRAIDATGNNLAKP